uniref:Uncharacterized protein n=1 Tax=Cucumis melo TaxID=3656 RepID=A0A9I9E8W3_CUCME
MNGLPIELHYNRQLNKNNLNPHSLCGQTKPQLITPYECDIAFDNPSWSAAGEKEKGKRDVDCRPLC